MNGKLLDVINDKTIKTSKTVSEFYSRAENKIETFDDKIKNSPGIKYLQDTKNLSVAKFHIQSINNINEELKMKYNQTTEELQKINTQVKTPEEKDKLSRNVVKEFKTYVQDKIARVKKKLNAINDSINRVSEISLSESVKRVINNEYITRARNKIEQLENNINNLSEDKIYSNFDAVKQNINETFEQTKNSVNKVGKHIDNAINKAEKKICEFINNAIDSINELFDSLNNLIDFDLSLGDASGINQLSLNFNLSFKLKLPQLKLPDTESLLDKIKNDLCKDWSIIDCENGFNNPFDDIINSVLDDIENLASELINAAENFVKIIIQGIIDILHSIVDLISQIKSLFSALLSLLKLHLHLSFGLNMHLDKFTGIDINLCSLSVGHKTKSLLNNISANLDPKVKLNYGVHVNLPKISTPKFNVKLLT